MANMISVIYSLARSKRHMGLASLCFQQGQTERLVNLKENMYSQHITH